VPIDGVRTCPKCQERVLPTADDRCPSCRQYKFVDAGEEWLPPRPRPQVSRSAADVIVWQHRYCTFMCVVYLLTIGMGVLMLAFGREGASAQNWPDDRLITGVVCVVFGVLLAPAYGLGPSLRPAPWVWTYHLVLIAIGLTSVCCLPICIPLLIAWIRSDVKQYYGRT
jgi:hypothetical protein